jgi:hypothetical protein
MAGYGYGISVSGSRKSIVASSTPAPSGIPVASTNQIVVTSSNSIITGGTWEKSSNDYWGNPNGDDNLFYSEGVWLFTLGGVPAASANGSADYIPMSGYTIIDGGGSITVAAAPSGIPVASTTGVNIIVPSFGLDGLFVKLAPDYWQGPEDYLLLFASGEWQVTFAGDVISFNTSAGQTVDYIPQTDWNVTTTITFVS